MRVHLIDFCIERNGREHHTEKYDAMHRNSTTSNLVVRRGQSFRLIVSFNRPFDSLRDTISFIFTLRDDDRPNHGHGTLNFISLKQDAYDLGDSNEWSCVIDEKHGNILEILVKSAANSAVGEWKFDIDTQTKQGGGANTYKCPNTVFILFNPWCQDDTVYMGGKPKPNICLFSVLNKAIIFLKMFRYFRSRGICFIGFDINLARILQSNEAINLANWPIRTKCFGMFFVTSVTNWESSTSFPWRSGKSCSCTFSNCQFTR